MKRFSYYQLAFLLLLLSLTLTGCQSRDKAPVQRQVAEMSFRDTIETAPDTLFSETRLMAERGAVLQRTRDIFSVIRNYQLSTGGLVMTELLDKAYCSKAWNNMLLAVRRKEFQTNTLTGEILGVVVTTGGKTEFFYTDTETTETAARTWLNGKAGIS